MSKFQNLSISNKEKDARLPLASRTFSSSNKNSETKTSHFDFPSGNWLFELIFDIILKI